MGLVTLLLGITMVASVVAGETVSSRLSTLSLRTGDKRGSASRVALLGRATPLNRVDNMRLRGGGNPVVYFDMTIGGQKAGQLFLFSLSL